MKKVLTMVIAQREKIELDAGYYTLRSSKETAQTLHIPLVFI